MKTAKIISPIDVETRKKLPISSGDTVRIWQKIVEKEMNEKTKEVKERSRLQAFDGLVIGRKHGREAGATFTVRKTIDGIGVERIFPLYSPLIDKIEILRRAKVRRAKLYHIRDKATKEIKRAMRHERFEKIDQQTATNDLKPATTEQKSDVPGGENNTK